MMALLKKIKVISYVKFNLFYHDTNLLQFEPSIKYNKLFSTSFVYNYNGKENNKIY